MDDAYNVKSIGDVGEVRDRLNFKQDSNFYAFLIYLNKSPQVYVGGPTLAIGYLNRPELNEQRFIKTPASLVQTYGPRLYRTGDWGYLLSDGSLEVIGRCDSMVKIRGYTVELKVPHTVPITAMPIILCNNYSRTTTNQFIFLGS